MNPASPPAAPVETTRYNELGHLVRQLHGTLRELGCDQAIQDMAGELPDTQDRLRYIAQLTQDLEHQLVHILLPAQRAGNQERRAQRYCRRSGRSG